MNLTILVDLDNTLLSNEDKVFIPAYLERLAQSIGVLPTEQILRHLWQSTGKMVKKSTPANTLKETFDQDFFSAIGCNQEDLAPVIHQFYTDVYPSLQLLTQPRPQAVQFIKLAQDMGCQVVIATNPILPRIAIDHRLTWAGLSPEQYHFDLITSYENMHFSKPHPEYLVEILAQLGWPQQPAVVVGNSFDDDIVPAIKLGMPFFYLSNQPLDENLTFPAQSRQGSLDDLIPWLQGLEPRLIHEEFATRESIMAILRATPSALDTLVRPLDDTALKHQPGPAEWSLTEIICHLRDVDREVNLPRFQRILTDDNPFLPGIDTDLWAAERQYQLQSASCALKNFIEVRTNLLSLLENYQPEVWSRPVKHAIFGPTHAEELISFIATHDQNHIAQAKTVLDGMKKFPV